MPLPAEELARGLPLRGGMRDATDPAGVPRETRPTDGPAASEANGR